MSSPAAQHILVCLHDFSRGGTERVAIGLTKRWVDAGREVTILCGTQEGGLRETVDARVRVVALDPPVRRGLFSRFVLGRAMGRKLASLRPDIIFLPGNFHLLLAPALRRADPRRAIVLKISNPPLPAGLGGFLARPVFRYFARAVDGFAVMGTGLGKDLSSLLPAAKTALLHDPVEIDRAVEPLPPRDEKQRQILWAGRLEPQKDVLLALRVIAALNAVMPAHLTILGDGAMRAELDRRIVHLGLGDVVTCAGYVPDIAPSLRRADVLLVTSHYEGAPAVAVEALAQGLPLVSTDCSYLLHDIVKTPQAGKILASRRPEALAMALSIQCRMPRPQVGFFNSLIAQFEPVHCAQAYLDWFDAMAGQHHA